MKNATSFLAIMMYNIGDVIITYHSKLRMAVKRKNGQERPGRNDFSASGINVKTTSFFEKGE